MIRWLIGLFLILCPGAAYAQQPNWLNGVYTLAAGPDNIYTNLPPAAYCFHVAWVVDRPVSAGFMVSDCTQWISDQGPPGTPGADGKSVLSGTGAPSGSLGSNGDFYVDVSVYRIYGPKTSGIWGSGVSLIGPQGSTGSPGINGSNGADGAAATISVGTVTTGAAGSSATVTNAGTPSVALLNFTIPRGSPGVDGAAGVNSFGLPISRTLALSTAYQASTIAKPAVVTINLSSTANLSLTGGTSNTADVVIGSTNSVAGGTGTAVCKYANTNTGALTIGLALSTTAASTCTFGLPAGWYFAVRQTAGTINITSSFDQVVG